MTYFTTLQSILKSSLSFFYFDEIKIKLNAQTNRINMNNSLKEFCASLVNPKFASTAVKVALIVGSTLFIINHGTAFVQGKMKRERWISAALTYLVPYCVNIHGQYISRSRQM